MCEDVASQFPDMRESLSRIDWEPARASATPSAGADDCATRLEPIERQLCERLPRFEREYASAKIHLKIAPDGRIVSYEVCVPLPEPRFCNDIKQTLDPFRIGSDRLTLDQDLAKEDLSEMLEVGVVIRLEYDRRSTRAIFGKKALDHLWERVLLLLLTKR